MTTFIGDVLSELKNNNTNLSECTFILPSKRAGIFLKHQISLLTERTIFSPTILSIEEFVQELSQLKPITNTELLFEFYNSYSHLTKKELIEDFDSFSKWGQTLLQDFNEIDRFLIPQEQIFNYLTAIQDLKHWSLQEQKTDFVKNYLAFWNKIYSYYNHLTTTLLNQKFGYQGLIYREAVENLESYIQHNQNTQHIFLGFNALNAAEETIIQELLQCGFAKIFWDIDSAFIDRPFHDAGFFTRQYLNTWPFFKKQPFKWISNNYNSTKNISISAIPKQIGQAKYIGALLKDLQKNNPNLERTAVVLGDENLLIPVINSLPSSLKDLNITMGFPLNAVPLASFFESLFSLYKSNSKSLYHKHLIKLISHQNIRPLFYVNDEDYASKIVNTITTNNLIYLDLERLKEIAEDARDSIDLIFSDWNTSVDLIINRCRKIILAIKSRLNKDNPANVLQLEYLFRFNELFNELVRLNQKNGHLKDISTLHAIYKELLNSESLDFQGEPLQGLQVMGMLESRVLDFETVIISSVNEGILPAGKTTNSFIPFDVKLENNLPTYKEKDAVYTYHFYRLLQRASSVYMLYNTEADTLLGGEKSRFITQLELEDIHQIKHQIVVPKVPEIKSNLSTIKKTSALVNALYDAAISGFSPSSLTNYIRNPIDFYYQRILKIKEYDDVEETVAANTLGTVVHNTLEDFYTPLLNQVLTVEAIQSLKLRIDERVKFHFRKEYKEGDISKGKNLIVFEIAKRYVSNFLNTEISEIQAGNQIKILKIESENNVEISIDGLSFPAKITGKVDRVDECNGVLRIIDYKTGNVLPNQVEVSDWKDITSDYKKYSKSFQVLTYAYIMYKSKAITLPIEAGIISFKNLGAGFLKFAKKETPGSRLKDTLITEETLSAFEIELKHLIAEICNPKIDFVEKKV